jgi:flotillin
MRAFCKRLMGGDDDDDRRTYLSGSLLAGLSVIGVGCVTLAATRFHVAKPNQRLLETGLGIKGTRISRWCIRWPVIRQVQTIDLSPTTLRFDVHALSKESLEYKMPMVWTLAPNAESDECIQRYATHALGDMDYKQFNNLMQGIIEGEARILAGKMELQEIQNNREKVQQELIGKIVPHLKQFGVFVHGGTISDLQDTPGQAFFSEARKRALAIVSNLARVEAANAAQKGDIGVQHADTETRKRNAELRCEATLIENEQRKNELESEATLKTVQAEAQKRSEIARVQAEGVVQSEAAKMRRQVEELRAQEILAKQRANDLMVVQVAAEKVIEESRGVSQSKLVKTKADAEALIQLAEAEAKSVKIKADAEAWAKQQEGVGLQTYLEKKAEGMRMLRDALGSSQDLQQLMMIEAGAIESLTTSTANALMNLKPNITVSHWNKGTDAVDTDPVGQFVTSALTHTAQVAKETERITGLKVFPHLFSVADKEKK